MTIQSGKSESKFEARSSKSETNSNSRKPKVLKEPKTKAFLLLEKISVKQASLMQRPLIHLVALFFLSAVCLSACAGKSATSKFFVLSSLPQSALSAAEGGAIGVLPVAMPDYLDRPQIVTRLNENEIRLDEYHRWAEPLKDSFTRVFVQNLSSILGSAKVVRTTESQGFPTALQVSLEVMQFDGTLGGEVVLIVKWGLFGDHGKKILLAKRESFKESTGAATYEALVAAHSKAVAALSREIAEAIRSRK